MNETFYSVGTVSTARDGCQKRALVDAHGAANDNAEYPTMPQQTSQISHS